MAITINRTDDSVQITVNAEVTLELTSGEMAFDFRRCPDDVLVRFMSRGMENILGDVGGAKGTSDAEKHKARAALRDRMYSGEWREGGGGGKPVSPAEQLTRADFVAELTLRGLKGKALSEIKSDTLALARYVAAARLAQTKDWKGTAPMDIPVDVVGEAAVKILESTVAKNIKKLSELPSADDILGAA